MRLTATVPQTRCDNGTLLHQPLTDANMRQLLKAAVSLLLLTLAFAGDEEDAREARFPVATDQQYEKTSRCTSLQSQAICTPSLANPTRLLERHWKHAFGLMPAAMRII